MTISKNNNATINKISLIDIRDMRNRLYSILIPGFNRLGFSEAERKIIVDALVYIEFKGPKDIILDRLCEREFVYAFTSGLVNGHPITFQNVINTTINLFKLKNLPEYNIEKMLEQSDISNYPASNLAIRIYLLKRKIIWHAYPDTDFFRFIFDKFPNYKTDDSIVLNCWESILYAMLQAKLIDIPTLQKCYENPFSLKPLIKLLDFQNSEKLTDKNLEKFVIEPYLIMLGNNKTGDDGLDHDMLSVPFSQKQILRMLITKSFDEKPLKMKLYSNWSKWTDGFLGTVKKGTFKSQILHNDFRIRPINKLLNDSKNL